MILMGQIHFKGHWKGWALKIDNLLGLASCHLGPKKSRLSWPTPSNCLQNGLAHAYQGSNTNADAAKTHVHKITNVPVFLFINNRHIVNVALFSRQVVDSQTTAECSEIIQIELLYFTESNFLLYLKKSFHCFEILKFAIFVSWLLVFFWKI